MADDVCQPNKDNRVGGSDGCAGSASSDASPTPQPALTNVVGTRVIGGLGDGHGGNGATTTAAGLAMAAASGASSMPPSPLQFSQGHHDVTPSTYATFGGALLFLGMLLATLLLLASSTLQPAGSGAATITPPSAMPPTGTPTLLSSPTSDGGGARLLDSRTIDDSMLDMSRQTSSAGLAGARWTRFFTNFFSTEPSTPLYLNAAPSPSQAANPPPDTATTIDRPGLAPLTADGSAATDKTPLPTPPPAVASTSNGGMSTDDLRTARVATDVAPTPCTIPWDDVPAGVQKWRSWRHTDGELLLHVPTADGEIPLPTENFTRRWGFVPSDDFYRALEDGDPDAWTFQDDLDDLVIEKGYHRTPLLADFALFDIGDAGDEDLREHLIGWGFAHHPHINPAPDDHCIGGEFDSDEDFDGGDDFVDQYEFLTSFAGSWHDDTPDLPPCAPNAPGGFVDFGVSLHRSAESAALDFAISRAADERLFVERCLMGTQDARAHQRGWGSRAWRQSGTRRTDHQQLLHETSRNGESRDYWGTTKRNRKRNMNSTIPASTPPTGAAAATPTEPLSTEPRTAATLTSAPTPDSKPALAPTTNSASARNKRNRRRSRKPASPLPPPSPFSTMTSSMQSAAAKAGM
jgi:hypothetical protein